MKDITIAESDVHGNQCVSILFKFCDMGGAMYSPIWKQSKYTRDKETADSGNLRNTQTTGGTECVTQHLGGMDTAGQNPSG